jgi:hypothetical protein
MIGNPRIKGPRPAQVARFVADFTRGFAFILAAFLLFFIMATAQ